MDYQGNSNKDKVKKASPAKEKKVEKVVSSEVIIKKKPLSRRMKEVLFGGELKNASRYIAAEVLLPAVRNLLVDATDQGVRRLVYGENTQQRRRTNEYRPRVSYNNPVYRGDPREFRPPDQPPRPVASRQSSNEIVLASREEAELVLERLVDILDTYEVASVADLYDLVDQPTAHVDNKWGWTYLGSTGIRQVREGFVLELPPTEPI